MAVRLDADVIVYRAGFAAEHTKYVVKWVHEGAEHTRSFDSRLDMLQTMLKEHDLDPGSYMVEIVREVEPVGNALYNVRSIVNRVKDELLCNDDDLILYLSGPTNYRRSIAVSLPYKGNRDPDHKPVHAAEIKAMMRREYTVITSDGEEADDKLGIDHYAEWLLHPDEAILCTIDKDLNMIPGLHYNFVSGNRYYVSPEEAIWNFYLQMLTGDSTDNIPGLRGIGPKRGEKALGPVGQDELSLFRKVEALYKEHGYGRDRLVEVGRLLWIRRNANEWWNPPEEIIDKD